MRFTPRKFLVLLTLLTCGTAGRAQLHLSGSEEIRQALARLNVLGSVLMIGAHPDDEHSNTLAYFARGRHYRTAYLAVTRGEGGQNLIGPEQGDLLGIIRTEELLAARRVDGAEQFFTRAIDFGYSKTAEETLEKWGRDEILSDIVWTIRKFRPDVIVLCFSGTPRDGHGQHQASSILGKEAFAAAADPKRFPEQLQWVEPWQAKRVMWNVYGRAAGAGGQVSLDTGVFDPVLGYSYTEIAGLSRSQHRSQAMGSPLRKGSTVTNMVAMGGEPASKDLFDGIDTSWNRIAGGAEAGRVLAEAQRSFDAEHPEKTIPLLLEARTRLAALRDPWVERKRAELDETIALCAGLWADASADRWDATPGSKVTIRATSIARLPVPVRLDGITIAGAGEQRDVPGGATDLSSNKLEERQLDWAFGAEAGYSQPYWLVEPRQGDRYTVPRQQQEGAAENAPVLEANFRFRLGSQQIELARPVWRRYVDRSRGELTRPLAVVPPVAVDLSEPVLVLPDAKPRQVGVVLKSNSPGAEGTVELDAPSGWRVEPRLRKFRIPDAGEEMPLAFEVTPPEQAARAQLRAVAVLGDRKIATGMHVIAYPHIPPQVVFPPAAAQLVRADIRTLARNIGYVMGAGDEMPEALRQIGCTVTLLSAADLTSGDLGRFDAIVTGVRAYNVRLDLRANQHRLLEYVHSGGTLVVQYNVLGYGEGPEALEKIGPYPIRISHDRVSVEEAPVAFPNPHSPLLETPNRISEADFDGWVQERGLYFASQWDPQYQTLLESHDPGEPARPGGTLYVRYGQGAYVFTAYSWFRELPAGVPGAFRIFANLLSAGKTLR